MYQRNTVNDRFHVLWGRICQPQKCPSTKTQLSGYFNHKSFINLMMYVLAKFMYMLKLTCNDCRFQSFWVVFYMREILIVLLYDLYKYYYYFLRSITIVCYDDQNNSIKYERENSMCVFCGMIVQDSVPGTHKKEIYVLSVSVLCLLERKGNIVQSAHLVAKARPFIIFLGAAN